MTTPDDQEGRLEAIQHGREASAVKGLIHPYIDNRISGLVMRMAVAYRSNQANHDLLLGTVAQIAGFMDLLSDLESHALRGEVAANKEMNNGSQIPGQRTN